MPPPRPERAADPAVVTRSILAAAVASTRPDPTAATILAVVIVVVVAAAAAAVILRPARALVALTAAVAGTMLAMFLYGVVGPGLVGLATLGAALTVIRVARQDLPQEASARRGRWLVAGGLLGALAFVLVGTWARQFVWTGRALPAGAEPGAASAVAEALAGSPALLALALVGLVIAAACAGAPRLRI